VNKYEIKDMSKKTANPMRKKPKAKWNLLSLKKGVLLPFFFRFPDFFGVGFLLYVFCAIELDDHSYNDHAFKNALFHVNTTKLVKFLAFTGTVQVLLEN
jgi:hypothetical protein